MLSLPVLSRSSIRRTRRAGGTFNWWRLSAFGLRNSPSCVDKPDVAEGLGEVAQKLSTDRIDLFREQADVADKGGGAFEDGTGLGRLAGPGQGLGQPERAQKERAFLALEPVLRPVAIHQSAIISKAFFGGVDRGQHFGIVGGKEPHQGQHQAGGVKLIGAEGLSKGVGPVAPAFGQDRLTDLVLRLLPSLDSVGGAETVR